MNKPRPAPTDFDHQAHSRTNERQGRLPSLGNIPVSGQGHLQMKPLPSVLASYQDHSLFDSESAPLNNYNTNLCSRAKIPLLMDPNRSPEDSGHRREPSPPSTHRYSYYSSENTSPSPVTNTTSRDQNQRSSWSLPPIAYIQSGYYSAISGHPPLSWQSAEGLAKSLPQNSFRS